MLIAREEIGALARILKRAGARIVFTNGCFDILHAGHVRYLAAAKRLGDVLILGLNTDASVRALKGAARPVNGEADRAEVVGALCAVDYVVLFGEATAEAIVGEIRPDVYAKGADYEGKPLPEADVVRKWGGEVTFLPLVPGRSTTRIIEKMKTAP